MKFLIVAALATVAIAAPQNYFYAAPYGAWPYGLARTVAAPIAAPIAVAPISHSKYHAQDVLGQASFGHAEPLQTRAEVRDALGNVRGSYSYVDPNGKVNVVEYTAGHGGFRVLGANNLPESVAVPETPALVAPEPVQDTAEVVAARAEFARLYKEAADAAAADKVPEVTRARRSLVYAAPIVAAPAVAKTTLKYSTYEPVDAAVPASTRKIELTEKEQDVYTPIAYSAPFAYAAAPFHYAAAPIAAVAPVEAKSAEVKTAAATTPLFYSAGYPFYHL